MTTSSQSSKVLFTRTDHRCLQESVNVPSISPILQLQKRRHRRSDCPGMISSVPGGRVLVTYSSNEAHEAGRRGSRLSSVTLTAYSGVHLLSGAQRSLQVLLCGAGDHPGHSQLMGCHGGARDGGGLQVPRFWSYPPWTPALAALLCVYPTFGEP